MRLFKMNWDHIECFAVMPGTLKAVTLCTVVTVTPVMGTDNLSVPPRARQGVPQAQAESGGILIAAVYWDAIAQRRYYPTGRGREGGWGGVQRKRLRETPETSNTLNS